VRGKIQNLREWGYEVKNEREGAAGITDDEPETRFQIYAGAIVILRENRVFHLGRNRDTYFLGSKMIETQLDY